MQDFSTLSCKSLTLARGLMTPATLPLATFLLDSALSVPDSSKPHLKYLNSETYTKQIPSARTSHSNPSSIQYHHLPLTCIDFQTSSSTHLKKISHYHRQVFLRFVTQKPSHSLLLPIPIFTSFFAALIHTLKNQGNRCIPVSPLDVIIYPVIPHHHPQAFHLLQNLIYIHSCPKIPHFSFT